jgi:hypothetical protein
MTTPAEKRSAAGRRLGSQFKAARSRSVTPAYPVPIQVRVGEELAGRLVSYGNRHRLSASDTIRTLLEAGLASKETP